MTILSLIIKSYSITLISIGLSAFVFFSLGVYMIIKRANRPVNAPDEALSNDESLPFHIFQEFESNEISKTDKKNAYSKENLTDLSAIAGDNIITTKLDLAHAFIESGREKMAKEILKWVLEQGNHQEKQEAERLFTLLAAKKEN